jgi:serine phosphatase RsbU (regulator of sigma subunit)
VVGIVLFSLALMAFSGPLADTTLGLGFADTSFEGLAVAAAITIGYILFMIFISGQGRTTLRLLTEMALAQRIHEALVPPLAYGNGRLEVLGVSQASSEMGGDLLDLVEHGREGVVDIFVADVAGHGVGAGVVMGMLKSSIRTGLYGGLSLEELARTVNAVLERTTRDEIYATLAALRIHDDGTVAVLLAGHHPVLHWSAAGGKLQRVHEGGAPLGLMADRRYAAYHLRAEPGDLLVAYTDGLNETHDAQERELGHAAIEEAIAAGAQAPLAELRRAVFELAERHGPQVDDRTLVFVRFR